MLYCCFLLSYFFLLISIEEKYRRTFFSFRTGKEQAQRLFTHNDEDEMKMLILKKNKHLWKPKEDEVVRWLNEMIPEWDLHKPAWYSDEVKARIPDEFVLDPSLLALIRNEEVMEILASAKERRRSWIGSSRASPSAPSREIQPIIPP